MKKTQAGIAHLSLLLLVIVAAVVAYAGYKVVQDNKKTPVAANSQPAAQTVQTIKNNADLNTVQNNLNSQNIDSGLNPGQFDQDVSSLL